jgi:hypothetical protein
VARAGRPPGEVGSADRVAEEEREREVGFGRLGRAEGVKKMAG